MSRVFTPPHNPQNASSSGQHYAGDIHIRQRNMGVMQNDDLYADAGSIKKSDIDTRGLNDVGRASIPIIPPEEHFKPKTRGIKTLFPMYAASKHVIPEFRHGVEPGSSTFRRVSGIAPESLENELPALLERNHYVADGSHIPDRFECYVGAGYGNKHHEMGQSLFRVIDTLREYLTPNDGETPPKLNGLEVGMPEFVAKPTKPLRALLEHLGYNLKHIDKVLHECDPCFRNNDYGIEHIQALRDLIGILKKSTSVDGFLEDFLQKTPDAMQDEIKEPFEFYSQKLIKDVNQVTDTFDKVTNAPVAIYIQRVLYDKFSKKVIESALKNLAISNDIKDNNFLREHNRKISEATHNFLKPYNNAISSCEGDVFNVNEVLKHIKKSSEAAEPLIVTLASIADDDRINSYPEFQSKFNDLIKVIGEVFSGPLSKDINILRKYDIANIEAQGLNTKNAKQSTLKSEQKLEEEINQALKQQNQVIYPSPIHVKESSQAIKEEKNDTWKIPAFYPEKTEKGGEKKKDERPPMVEGEDFLRHIQQKFAHAPNHIARPLDTSEMTRPAPFDDPYLRETQNLVEWSDYAGKMKAKLDTLNQIGNTIQEIALAPMGRPDPEFVALARRRRRLSDLNDIIQEVPKCNRMSQRIEQGALKAQHDYVKGVGKILSDKFRLQAEEANQRVQLDQMSAKAATGLASKALETSLILAKQHEQIFNMFIQIQEMRDNNTWQRIKSLVRGFKW